MSTDGTARMKVTDASISAWPIDLASFDEIMSGSLVPQVRAAVWFLASSRPLSVHCISHYGGKCVRVANVRIVRSCRDVWGSQVSVNGGAHC
jgi:hypothetical protein